MTPPPSREAALMALALLSAMPLPHRSTRRLTAKAYSVSSAVTITPLSPEEAPVSVSLDNTPRWFTGRWIDWHRGHGCDKDDENPRAIEGTAEIDTVRGLSPHK